MGLRVGLRIPHFLRLTPDSGIAALLTFICPWLLDLISRDLLLDLSPRVWNELYHATSRVRCRMLLPSFLAVVPRFFFPAVNFYRLSLCSAACEVGCHFQISA